MDTVAGRQLRHRCFLAQCLQRDFRLQFSRITPSLPWYARLLFLGLDPTLASCPNFGVHLCSSWLAAVQRDARRAALAANLDAANDGDPAGWAALYTEDAVMMHPNAPAVEERSAIASWLAMLPAITDAEGTGWRSKVRMLSRTASRRLLAPRARHLELGRPTPRSV